MEGYGSRLAKGDTYAGWLLLLYAVGLRTCILGVELRDGLGPLTHGPDELQGRFHLHVRPHAQQAGRVEVDACVGYFDVDMNLKISFRFDAMSFGLSVQIFRCRLVGMTHESGSQAILVRRRPSESLPDVSRRLL